MNAMTLSSNATMETVSFTISIATVKMIALTVLMKETVNQVPI